MSTHQSINNAADAKLVKPKAIKSFLFTPSPQITPAQQVKKEIKEEAVKEKTTPIEKQSEAMQGVAQETIEKPAPQDTATQTSKESKLNDTNVDANLTKNEADDLPKKSGRKLSAYENLQQLNRSIAAQQTSDGAADYFQHRSLSGMHKQPHAVPTSIIPETAEEKRKSNSQQLEGGLTVIKGDDGTCFVERDLGVVGMEGVKSRESFKCGQSKFDKAFKEHMKRALKKFNK